MPKTVIVQYVPDAVRNERINIGVIVLHNGKASPLFLDNWQRVKQFAGKDVDFLKAIKWESRSWDESAVLRLSQQWTGSVQFSEPRFTTLSPDAAKFDAASRYLVAPTPAVQGYRDKTYVVKLVKRRIREKLTEKIGPAGGALIKDASYELKGAHSAYRFDVCVGNGEPYFSAQGISFEVPSGRRLEKEITSTAWLIEDVRRLHRDFPIGIAVLPPKTASSGIAEREFGEATAMFQNLGATVIQEHDLSEWADRMANTALPPSVYRRFR